MQAFVYESVKILGDKISGIYLHGSAVMGCFNSEKSDIDLIIVINNDISDDIKHSYLDMLMIHNEYAPSKGIELSIVKEEYCNPFVYPTPFELHFSIAHIEWYKNAPKNYVEKMKGTDKDLAAHFTIIYHRGKCLYGKEIREVFGKVNKEEYFDSIWNDIADANDKIVKNSMYIVLNLCRVLAYKRDNLILSKAEGGNWGIDHLPLEYHSLISDALNEYCNEKFMHVNELALKEFASFMVQEIR